MVSPAAKYLEVDVVLWLSTLPLVAISCGVGYATFQVLQNGYQIFEILCFPNRCPFGRVPNISSYFK